jgi:carbonic anhydrase
MRCVCLSFVAALPLVVSLAGAGALRAEEPSRTDLRQRLTERLAKPEIDPVALAAARANGRPVPSLRGAVAVKPKAKPKAAIPWGYTGEGAPARWAEIDPANRLCAVGTRQSPIDIRDTFRVEQEPIQFDYRASGFTVLDNGHTVQVNVDPGNSLTVRGQRFELQMLQFRRPSEERINGRQYDMSVQLFHKDAQGRQATVAVLLERGQDQAAVQTIWNNLPLEKREPFRAQVPLDLNHLLPAERGYFTYMGSQTTPPCTEGMLWMVLRQPVPVSPQQLGIFNKLYPMNARPVQASSGRIIKESF